MTKLTELTTEYRNELINSFRLNNKVLELHTTEQFYTPDFLINTDYNYFTEQIEEGNWEGYNGTKEEFEDFLDDDLAKYDELNESKFEILKNQLYKGKVPTLNDKPMF